MPKLRIYIPVLVAFLSLAAAMTATAADELKIVYNVGVAPLEFEDAKSRPAGLLPDLWRLWAQKSGQQIQFVKAKSFQESLQLLNDGKVDLHTGLFRTPEHEEFLEYSEQLLALNYYIFTHPSVHPIKTLEKTSGFIVGIQKGGYTEQFVRSKVPANRIAVYDRFQDLFLAALEGEIRVFVTTELTLLYYLKENFFTNIFEYGQDRPLFSQVYYTATRKGNPLLIQQVNDGLKAIDSVERKLLEDKWIVKDFSEIPREPAAARPGKEIEQSRFKLALTAEERTWLDAHPEITIGVDGNWPPIDFMDKEGRHAGIAADYLRLMGERLGVTFKAESSPTFKEMLGKVRDGDLMAGMTISQKGDRNDYLYFTDPYFQVRYVIVTRNNLVGVNSLSDLAGLKVAVEEGYWLFDELKKNYPEIKTVAVANTKEAIQLVSWGKADAYVGNQVVAYWLARDLQLPNLDFSADAGFAPNPQRFAVHKDEALLPLAAIIDKALATITADERRAIESKWLGGFGPESGEPAAIELSPIERAWIEAHPVIRVHNEQDWPPFNYFEYGSPRGLSIDYMDLVAEKLGFKVEYVTGPSWNEFLGMVKRKELDVMLNIVKTEDRMKYLLYTEPYVKNPNVIVSLQESPHETIQALFGKTVAFPKGFFYEEVLTKSFPKIKRLPVEDTLASLKAVSFGKADAALGEAAVMRTLINKNLLTGLRISGEVNIGNPDLTNLRLGVRDDWPLLHTALMKAMAAVKPEEMTQIRQKWAMADKREIFAGDKTIPFSTAERAWLAEHKTIRFTGDPDWLPQEAFTSTGQYIGIVADILDLLEARLGILFERVPVKTWNEAVRLAETAEVDVLSETTSSERDTMTFTRPYLGFPVVIIAKQGTQPISNPGELKGKRVAVVKDYGYVIPLRRQFPDLDYVAVDAVRDGLMRLSAGEVDAFISAVPTASHLMSELGLTNLKVVGSTGLSIDLGFGVRKDMPVLVSILDKALAGITADEKLKIRQKWVPVIDIPASQSAVPISYGRLILYGIAVFLILSLLTWILIKAVKKEQIAVNFGSRWFRGLVLAGLSFFVIVVCLLGWFTLERNRKKNLEVVGENLTEILKIADDRLHLWVEQRTSFLKLLGRDPELVTLTKRLLAVTPERESLLASDALRDTRAFFKTHKDIFANIGFFIINADHISIGSMRDANIGTRNLIAQQSPDLLRRAFEDEVLFVPPIESDVPLGTGPKADGARNRSTQFFMGPIRDTNGQIMAVMTLRVDPSEDFSRVLTSFEMRKTFEIYAFSEHGELLSESRFDDQLRRIGLIAEGQQSAFNIAIRDPGVNLVKGLHPKIERSQQPLTLMAFRAIQLKLDMEKKGQTYGHSKIELDTKGYRDYRGVPVFGAWLWNVDLGLGLATEIDVAKALSNYYQIRRTIFGVLGFTLFLSVGAVLLVLILGERTSRALMTARDNLEARVDERTAELQEKQEQLKVAEERSRLLLDSVGEGIFGVDLEGKVAFTNPAANRILGYEADELIGQNVHQKIHHSHADGSSYPKETCPMYLSHVDGTDHHVTDEVLWRKDGTSFPVEYTSMPIKKDGRVVGAVVTFMDITERRDMETQLESTKSQLQYILDTSPIGVAFSTKGHILFANPRFKEMFGVGIGDASPDLYVHPEERDTLISELNTVGKVENYDLQLYNREHQVRDMLITYLPITYDGEEGILGWLLDITDRKTAEKEIKEKYEELSRFRRLAIGREQKMIELKKEINEFLKGTGNSEKYKIH